MNSQHDTDTITEALAKIPGVSGVNVREKFIEAVLDDKNISDDTLREAVMSAGAFTVLRID